MSKNALAHNLHRVENFFDRLKLSYKWRFDRWSSLHIVPYLGYGTRESVLLQGRVLDDKPVRSRENPSRLRNLRDNWRRIETDEVPDATVELALGDWREEVRTDGDGFFHEWVTEPPLPGVGPWHAARVSLRRPEGHPAEAKLEVFVPDEHTEYIVVSDMDDTVIHTGATNFLRMAKVMLFNSPTSRTPFPGVAAFYRGLADGSRGQGGNPIFYVSSSPWNFYNLFIEFLDHHDIPRGPLLLKDFGFSETKLWKTGHEEHKLAHIRDLMALYPDLPFLLLGDSGQRDPEIFHTLAQEAPERIKAVFLRDVTPPERDREVQRLGDEATAQGVPWILADTSAEAARRAVELGLVTEAAAQAADRQAAEEGPRC